MRAKFIIVDPQRLQSILRREIDASNFIDNCCIMLNQNLYDKGAVLVESQNSHKEAIYELDRGFLFEMELKTA